MSFDFSSAALDREFPVRRSLLYFNHAAVAALPRRVAAAMTAQVENQRWSSLCMVSPISSSMHGL